MSGAPALAQRIQRAMRAMAAQGCETVVVAPYAAYIDHDNELPFFSCAMPQEGAAAPWDPAAIGLLEEAFAGAAREPRFQIVDACWPGLSDALVAHGFRIEARLVGATCAAEGLVTGPGPPGLALERVDRRSHDAAIADLLHVKWAPFEGLDGGPPVDVEAIARFRRTGASSVIARTGDGEVAGSAGWLGIHGGIGEIIAVGVLPRFRRRGIAGALVHEAGRAAADAGAELLFLTYDDEGAGRVYARAGFTPAPGCEVLKLACPASG